MHPHSAMDQSVQGSNKVMVVLNDQRFRILMLCGFVGFANLSLVALQVRGQIQPNPLALPTTAIQTPDDADPNKVFNRWEPVPIVFPAHPPPLGVPLNAPIANHPAGPVTEKLFGEMLEPYFPQLTSRLLDMHEHVTRREAERLSEYRGQRDKLLAELRKVIKSTAGMDGAARMTAFSELARSQAPELREQEKRAESLRRGLQSGVSWYELRRWQLGAGSLNVPREKLEPFEYQVIRATAYYRNGLSPSQRRVLLESLQLMDSETTDGEAVGSFVFFSPDMMLVRFPDDLPENLAERVRAFVELKNTMRTQLRDAAYFADFPKSGYSRKKALRRFVTESEGRLEALEDTAEQIRIDLMPTRDTWRRSPPVELPAELLAAIDEYVLGKRELSDLQIQAMRAVHPEQMPADAYDNPDQLEAWRKDYMDRMKLAQQGVLRENAETVVELDAILDRIEEMLAPYVIRADEVVGMHAADGLLMKFLKRYREEAAFYEYDIAAFEPGLSPLQRNLLFAGAVARLQLPLAGPETQPIFAPQTLVPAK